MPPISFVTDAYPDDLPSMFRQMACMVGWQVWAGRIKALKSEVQNPLWRSFLLERYGLEMAFGDIHQYQRSTGRFPWPPRTAEEYRFYSFLAVITRVHARLSPGGQKKLSGALRSGLEKGFGLGPLAFEMKIVSHLMARGFGIELHDLEGDGGYDFLASLGPQTIEVECKHVSGDAGRQIPLRDLYNLGGAVHPTMMQAVNGGNGGRFIHVTLPGRLTSNKADQSKILDRINAILSGNATAIDDDVCIASERSFTLDNSPFSRNSGQTVTMDDVHNYLKREFSIENANVLLNWRPNHAAVVVWLQSKKNDTVPQNIFRRLKDDAKRQFSGSRPAFLCVHFAALTDEQLLGLAETERAGTETAFQRMASVLLQKFSYLHTIAMMTDGEVQIAREESSNGGTRTSIREIGPSYVFKNPNHPLGSDVSLDLAFEQMSPNTP